MAIDKIPHNEFNPNSCKMIKAQKISCIERIKEQKKRIDFK